MGHNDTANLSSQVYGSIMRAKAMGFLTDAGVAAADTKAGLKAFIESIKGHNDQENWKILLKRALDYDAAITDAAILSLTTVDQLAALVGSGSNVDVLE